MPPKYDPLDRLVEFLFEQALFPALEDGLFPIVDQLMGARPVLPGKKPVFMRPPRKIMPKSRRAAAPVRKAPPAPTHYDTLQVSPKADHETIQAAFRSLSLRFHPDRNPGNPAAAERMIRIAQAWEVLGDPAKRAAYDRTQRIS